MLRFTKIKKVTEPAFLSAELRNWATEMNYIAKKQKKMFEL
jgi:hypothetical protein